MVAKSWVVASWAIAVATALCCLCCDLFQKDIAESSATCWWDEVWAVHPYAADCAATGAELAVAAIAAAPIAPPPTSAAAAMPTTDFMLAWRMPRL